MRNPNCNHRKCYLDVIVRMIEEAKQHPETEADPLVDMEETKGELHLHNAYVMLMQCQQEGCNIQDYFNELLEVDKYRLKNIDRKERQIYNESREYRSLEPEDQ